MEPVIEVHDLHFSYPDNTPALRGVDLVVQSGEAVAVFGPNGSGKTSFLLHLVGLLEGKGSIRICGRQLDRSSHRFARQKIGVLFQDSDDQLFMPTVAEDVAFGPLNMRLPPAQVQQRVHRALGLVGMQDASARAPFHLSAGEKRRVALAGVLAMDPEIIVLDEPATFLDPPGRRQIAGILQDLPQAKLIVTHDSDFGRNLCERAVFFEHGRIVADGPTETIVDRFDWNAGPPPGR